MQTKDQRDHNSIGKPLILGKSIKKRGVNGKEAVERERPRNFTKRNNIWVSVKGSFRLKKNGVPTIAAVCLGRTA